MKITTLCYIENGGRYLMMNRNKKKNDPNGGKWIGIGGHLEKGETPDECIIREIAEETGLVPGDLTLAGTVFFFSDKYEDECIFLYTAHSVGDRLSDCNEGTLEWIEKDKILSLPLWEGDREFLSLLLNSSPLFTVKLEYEGEKLVGKSVFFQKTQ